MRRVFDFQFLAEIHLFEILKMGEQNFNIRVGRILFDFWFQTCHFLHVVLKKILNVMSSWGWGVGGIKFDGG